MAKSWRLVAGVALFAGGANVGCGAPERTGDPVARADDRTATETKRGALTTSLFQPYVAYATGSAPAAVAIGDLDGDGRSDVALLTSGTSDPTNDNMVHVFLQDVDGSLKPRVRYPVGRRGSSIDIGDVNGDGRADVVVGDDASNGSWIGVLSQNAAGTLDAIVPYATANAYRVKVADFNGDGRPDVAGLGWGGTGIDVFVQTESGALAPPVTYPAPHDGLDELDAGDVNGDGLIDAVVSCGTMGPPNLTVLAQMPDGTLGAPTSYSTGSVWSTGGVAVGDTNGDGRSDIVVSYGGNRPTSFIARFPQNAQGAIDPPVSYPSYDIPSAIVMADLDGDARKDVLVAHSSFARLGVYRQFPSGDLGGEELIAIPNGGSYQPQALAVGDVNGDGRLDAVVADHNNGLIVLRHVQETSLSLAITAPAGGTVYTNTPLTVRWRAGDTIPLAGFDLSISFNNGVSYAPMDGCTGLPATATECTWTPTGQQANGARIRVTARDAGGNTAFAETTFNLLTAVITILSPPPAQQYIGGATIIQWVHNLPPTGTVRIELSRDGGATYETLADAAPLTTSGGVVGSFPWTVTGPPTTNGRLRLTANGSLPVSAIIAFAISTPPTMPVTVTTTIGGVVYTKTGLMVNWTPNVAGATTVRIELSRDGGATFQMVAASAPNRDGYFSGSITGPSATDARVRVTANGAVPATGTSASFTLVEPSVVVTGPAAGSVVYAGASTAITWTSNLPATSFVNIDLSRDGGSTYQALMGGFQNSGSVAWVPTGAATSAAVLRVRVGEPATTVVTSAAFTIAVPSVTVTSPAPGNTFVVGMPQAITWSTDAPATLPVSIQLSRDGINFEVLATNAPNTGTFAWVVTGPPTGAAAVVVTIGSKAATSGTFAIVAPSVTVTAPAAGAVLYPGTPLAIAWTSNLPATSTVTVELSRDGGGTFETLAAAIPNAGILDWLVNGPDSAAVVARVTVTAPVAASGASGAFTIVTPSLTVTGPAAGTLAYAGTPVTITWTDNLPDVDPVTIELSRDGGATFALLDVAAAHTGSFVWTASGPDTAEARARVTSSGGAVVSDVGPAFQIVNGLVTVTSPGAGDSWAVGTGRTIAWSSNLPADATMVVELSRDGGGSWETLASAQPAGGSLAWTASGPATGAAIVRVSAEGSVPAAGTSGTFAIGNPAVAVTSPAAGASWTIGTAQTIAWSTNLLTSATVKIQVSRNGGSTYSTLASAAPNTGSFAWTPTGSASSNAIVRVSANGFAATGLSGTFSLAAAGVTVTAPNTAVSWAIGSVQTITWTHNLGPGAQFLIEVSRGGVWSTIAPAVPGGGATSGSYDWTVVGPATSNAKIRVTWTGGTTVKDSSDVAFRIK